MVIEVLRFFIWLLAGILVGLFEYATGIPILTLTIVALTIKKSSTIWFISYTAVISIVLAALYLEGWFVVWAIISTMGWLLRWPFTKTLDTSVSKIAIVVAASLLLAIVRDPIVSLAYVIHSFFALLLAGYILWRSTGPKSKGLAIGEL